MRLLPLSGIAGSVIFVALAVSLGAAEAQAPAAAPRGTVVAPPPADNPAPAEPRAARGPGAAETRARGGGILLKVKRATLARRSGPAATVFVANPDIADVQVK